MSLFLTTGCLQNSFFSSKIRYEASPVKVSYELTYGYQINTSGEGIATVHYQEYLPKTQNGSVTILSIQPIEDYEEKELGNQLLVWNQTINHTNKQSFLITAYIIQEPIIITDLSGKSSMTIAEIQSSYPSLIEKYCKPIGNESQTIICPSHPEINYFIQNQSIDINAENAFVLGKQLFSLLKNHTTYVKHSLSHPQPANVTYTTKVGDCDDLTYLYLSLCRSIGLPSRYVKGYIISNTTAVAHMWAEIFVGKKVTSSGWIPVECAGTGEYQTEIHHHYGLEDSSHLRLCIDDGTNETFKRLNNPIEIRYEPNITVNISRLEHINNYTEISTKQLIIDKNNRYYE